MNSISQSTLTDYPDTSLLNNKDIDIDVFKNDICKLTVINKTKYINRKINVLSAVFFKSRNYYKNYSIYVSGLKKLMFLVDNSISNFKLILFIDINVRNDNELMNMIKRSKKTIPILFRCSEYMNDDYHIDLFPTLVRFFPFFDFQNNFTKTVIMVDIDLKHDDRNKLRSLLKINNDNIICAGDIAKFIYEEKIPYLYAGMVSSRKKFNKNIITDFIKNAHNINSKGYYEKRLTTFGYGIDEIFLNDYLVKNQEFSIMIDYQISYFIYHSRKYLLDPKHKNKSYNTIKLIIDGLKNISINEFTQNNRFDFKDQLTSSTKIIPDDNSTIEELLDFIDQNTYSIRKRTDINDILSTRFYEAIKYSLDENKRFLQKNVMDFISTYLLNIISCKLIVSIKNNKITSINKYEIVYDSTR
jgi:hypothetical protein